MKKIIFPLLVVSLVLFVLFRLFSGSAPSVSPDSADLILFWGDGCPHCETVKKYIQDNNLDAKIKIAQLEVYFNKTNQNRLQDTVKKCPEIDTSRGIGVPLAFAPADNKCLLGDQPIIDWLSRK